MSGLRHDKEVLDSDATDPSTIEPRLDGHHLTWRQLILFTHSQPRRLVYDESDAMTRRMCDEIHESTLSKLRAAPLIDVAATHTWLDHLHCFALHLSNGFVHLVELGPTVTDQKCASHVRVIAINESANVDHERIPFTDDAVTRSMMRHRRVFTTCHDGVVAWTICACQPHPVFEFVAHVALSQS